MQLSMEFTEAHGRCSAASEACGNMVEHASSLFMQSVVSWKPLHHCSVVADSRYSILVAPCRLSFIPCSSVCSVDKLLQG